MRFSYLLSAFLATIAIASPIANPTTAGNTNLAVRAKDVDTDEWKLATGTKSGLKKDDWVWFTLEWNRNTIVGDGDTESAKEISDLRDELGFDHIGIVIGQITEVDSGKGKNKKTTRDFKAAMYHMIEVNDKTELKPFANWKVPSKPGKTLRFGGMTSSKKDTAAGKEAKEYFANGAHAKYAVNGNNCNDFVNAVKAKL